MHTSELAVHGEERLDARYRGVWQRLEIEDLELIERWVQVIRPMNVNYGRLTVDELRGWMSVHGGETWLYTADGCEIALRFHFVPKRRRYQLSNVGLSGEVPTAVATELVIDKCCDFVRRHKVSSLFALRPKIMSNPAIQAFHQQIAIHPRLVVTVEHESAGLLMWTLKQREIGEERG